MALPFEVDPDHLPSKETTLHYGERIYAEGVQEGLRQAGVILGFRYALKLQLRRKFGAIDDVHLTRIEAADEAQLDRFIERILTATSIDEVFAEPSA